MKKTIELPLEFAKTLLRALPYADAIPTLAPAHRALFDAVHDAEETGSALDRLRRRWDEGFAEGRARAQGETIGDVAPYLDEDPEPAGVEPVPRWDYVAKAIRIIERDLIGGDVAAQRDADQLQAYVRDTFDALGISIRHEPSLYVAITTASLLVELSNNGREKGLVDEATVLAVARIAQSFTASLIPYLPPEARR